MTAVLSIGNTAPDRPAVYQDDDGIWAFRPSMIGRCQRGLVAARLGMAALPLDEDAQRICEEGHIHEPHIVNWFQKQGFLVRRSLRVGFPVSLYSKITGEVDGVAWKDEDISGPGFDFDPGNAAFPLYGIEIKAMGDKPWAWTLKESTPSEEYLWQLSAYWACLEFFYARRLAGYYFIFKCRSNGKIEVFFFKEPPYTAEQVIERIQAIEWMAEERVKRKAKGENYWPTCDRDDLFCPWKPIHDYDFAKYDATMEPLAKRYFELKVIEEEAKEELKEVKWSLLRALAGRKKVKSGQYTISISPGRERFDQTACFREFPSIRTQFRTKGEAFLKLWRPRGKNSTQVEEVGEEDADSA